MMKMKVLILTGFLTILSTENVHAACKVTQTETGEVTASAPGWAPKKTGNRYTIKGVAYTPLKTSQGYSKEGYASWYGRPFHGRQTANGETYNMFDFTAAHPTLPIPSCVRVTNLDNGKSVIVRINDRGPYKSDLGTDTSNRIIDLSMRTAVVLGFRNKGIARVKVEAIPAGITH